MEHVRSPRAVAASLVGTLTAMLLIGSASASSTAFPAAAAEPTAGYAGYCLPKDSHGVTVVVDFQDLDGNDGRPADTIVRCSPVKDNDATVERTGLQALADAGIVAGGTDRWGDSYPESVPFVCRIGGRPDADEPLQLTASGTTYYEACGDTPPSDAHWSYWHGDGQAEDWVHSDFGLMARHVVPGGFEGWSFSTNVEFTGDSEDVLEPRTAPVNPQLALSFGADKTELVVGESFELTWTSTGGDHLVAGGSWNGRRLLEGTEIIKPDQAGTYSYALKTVGLDPPAERSVTVTVTGAEDDAVPTVPAPPSESSAAAHARTTAGWLVNELSPTGQMPGPHEGTDWGLTIDSLWALHATGTGAKASKEITAELAGHAGLYLGPDLFGAEDVRIAGSTVKLLVAAIVVGKDPEAFGTGKYLPPGETYDLRQETLDLLQKSGGQKGRVASRGTGNDETNIFAQSLAVIGLSRSGGVPVTAVDFLTSQQCAAGYFRMFYPDTLSCDAAQGAPDGDGTAMGLQALMTARANGVEGLDDDIDRGLDWLLAAQRKDGSFASGDSTKGANANSTGLIAQTLFAGAADQPAHRRAALEAAYAKARDWVLTVHAHEQTAGGSTLDVERELGAIAYNKGSFNAAKSAGIGSGERDQWRRATAQAVFALTPVSFADLGTTDLIGDPIDQNKPGNADDDDAGGGAAPPPGSSGGTPVSPVPTRDGAATTPKGKAAAFLAGHLVDGDHIEVTIDDKTYVDYDATTDVVFALRALGEQPRAIRKASAFLLHPRSVAAYARGEPYEKKRAAYAEPTARLALIARFWRADGQAPKGIDATIRRLDHALADLRDTTGISGTFDDTGDYADRAGATERHAWATLATTAAGGSESTDDATRLLLAAQCDDGTFPERLSDTSCATGDLAATELAVQALNAQPPATVSMQPSNVAPTWWADDRVEALDRAGRTMLSRTDASGTTGDASQIAEAARLAGARQFIGLDATNTANTLGERLGADGGIPRRAGDPAGDFETSLLAATGLAGRSWASAPRSPVTSTVRLPHAEAPASAAPASAPARAIWLAPAVVVALLLLMFLAWAIFRATRHVQPPTQKGTTP